MRECALLQEQLHLIWSYTAWAAIPLQDEGSDGCGMRRGRAGAREVGFGIQVANVISTEEGSVGVISCGDAWLRSHFRNGQAITHVVEVDRSRAGGGVILRNAHPED